MFRISLQTIATQGRHAKEGRRLTNFILQIVSLSVKSQDTLTFAFLLLSLEKASTQAYLYHRFALFI